MSDQALPPAVLTGPSLDAEQVRARLVDVLRRDLIGPGPEDVDIARERLKENPSRWYLTGYLAPAPETAGLAAAEAAEALEEEGDPVFGDDEGADPETGRARAQDDGPADEPSSRPRRLPSSLGLTVLVDASVREVEVTLTWGDYTTIPPLPPEVLLDEQAQYDPSFRSVQWQRVPGVATVRLPVPEDGRGNGVPVSWMAMPPSRPSVSCRLWPKVEHTFSKTRTACRVTSTPMPSPGRINTFNCISCYAVAGPRLATISLHNARIWSFRTPLTRSASAVNPW